MLKVLIVPGALAVAAVAFLERPAAGPDQAASRILAEASDPGCSGGSGPWLPGSLQIKDRSGAGHDAEAGLRIKRDRAPSDCALV